MPRTRWASTSRVLPRWSRDARRLGLGLAFAVGLAATAGAAELTGRVVAVADGDTLTVLVDGRREVRVRLWGIDAPERGQPWSRRSRDGLAARALRRDARIAERGTDGFGRVLARVSVDGADLAEAQLRDGYAWVFRRYTSDPGLLALEDAARAARRGLWSRREPEPPWRFRDRTQAVPSGVSWREHRREAEGAKLGSAP